MSKTVPAGLILCAFVSAGACAAVVLLFAYGVTANGLELTGGAVTGSILGYLAGRIAGAMQAHKTSRRRALKLAGTTYIVIALIFLGFELLGSGLAIHGPSGESHAGGIVGVATAPLRALLWPVYFSIAVLSSTVAFIVCLMMALVLALLLVVAWQRYAPPLLGEPASAEPPST